MTKKKKKVIIISVCVLIAVIGVLIFVFYPKNRLFDFDYAKTSEALSEVNGVVGNTYENIVLPDKLDVPDVDKLYTFETDMSVFHDDKAEKKAGELAEAFGLKSPGIEYDEYYGGYYAETDKGMVSISSKVFGFSYVADEHYRAGEQKIIAEYNLKRDDISNVSYNLGGEEYKAEDAVKFAESFINEKIIPVIECSEGCVPVKLFVTKEADGRNTYLLYFSHLVDGVEMECVENSAALPDMESMRASTMIVGMFKKDSIDYFWNTSYFNLEGEKKEVKKIITLESALEYLEDLLAEYKKYEVSEINLKYSAHVTDPFDDIISFRPYWTFTVLEKSAKGKCPLNQDNLLPTVIYVDAIDGSTYCMDYSNSSNRMLFKNVDED